MSNHLPAPPRKRDRFKTIFKGRSVSQTAGSSSQSASSNTLAASATQSLISTASTDARVARPNTIPIHNDEPAIAIEPPLDATVTPTVEGITKSQQVQEKSESPQTKLWEEALSKLSEVEQQAVQSIQVTSDSSAPLTERVIELVALTREKQRRCEMKAFKFRFRGQEIILRDVAEKVIVFLNKFKTIGDVAVSFDPTHAALPWAGIRFLIQAAVGEQEQMGSLLIATEKITYLTNRCIVYEAMYREDSTPEQALQNFHDALVNLYAAMLRMIAVAHHLLSKHMVTRAMNALFDPERVLGLLKDCDDLEKRVDVEAGNCHRVCSAQANTKALEWLNELRRPISRVDENVLFLLDQVADRERQHILYWTSPVLYGSNHDMVCQKRTLGTCEWILQRKSFLEWQQTSCSVIMWLHGTAGTGKTFLTSKVIDNVRDTLKDKPNHEGFAYFYCNRNENDRREILSILRSFARQLSAISREKERGVQKSLLQLHKECLDQSREPKLVDCKSLIREFINLYPRTTIILDALDECDKDKREELIAFFDEIIVSAVRPVKVFISSRPDVDIKERFSDRSNIEIQATDNQDDISLYVRTQMSKHRRWSKFSLSLREEVVETLETRGNGMFQWVYLQIKQLLDLRLEREIRERLGKLPPDLEAAYREIINNMSQMHRLFFDRACQWVMAACKPLSSDVMLKAVSQDPFADTLASGEDDIDEETLLEYCHNLLVIDSTRKIWIPSHLSVVEYIEVHLWSPQEANYLLGTLTLLAVNDPGFCTLLKMKDQGPS